MYQCRLFQNSETVETGWIYGSCYTITDQILLDGSQLNNNKKKQCKTVDRKATMPHKRYRPTL